MLAWGPMKGYSGGRYSLAEAADRCKQQGYEWVALELDDDETGVYNRSIWPDYRNEFRSRGMLAGCWFTAGGSIYLTPPDSDLMIAELEGPGDYDGIVYCEQALTVPDVPKAVCTNFSTIDSTRAKFLIDRKYTCLTECYLSECASCTPENQDFTARSLGWPTSQPVFGVYGGKTTADYAQWASWPGVDYLIEYVI